MTEEEIKVGDLVYHAEGDDTVFLVLEVDEGKNVVVIQTGQGPRHILTCYLKKVYTFSELNLK
tara:strand:- start:239 stop:427 length:189 start_codon:yes stop_codon:yes gene_type:complete